jgi:hypothetical protein
VVAAVVAAVVAPAAVDVVSVPVLAPTVPVTIANVGAVAEPDPETKKKGKYKRLAVKN